MFNRVLPAIGLGAPRTLILPSDRDTWIKLVQIVSRHGQRSPLIFYPDDPYKNVTIHWPLGLAQLTTTGKQQMYDLGLYLGQTF